MGRIVEWGSQVDVEDEYLIKIDEISRVIEQNQSSINKLDNFFENNSIHDVKLPTELLLDASHFYGASGIDTSPIPKMKKLSNSFIYSDFYHYENDVLNAFNENNKIKIASAQSHYPTYELHEHRTIDFEELTNANTIFGRTGKFLEMRDLIAKNKAKDFYTLEEIADFPKNRISFANPNLFAHWFVFKYNKRYVDSKYINDTNPKYLSILYISADTICTYKGLYNDNKIAPSILTLLDTGNAIYRSYLNLLIRRSYFSKIVSKNQMHPKIMNCLTDWFMSSFINIQTNHKVLGSFPFADDRQVTISTIEKDRYSIF
ncbi:MAG: hypothetical protein J0L55_13950 [Caulobacterales bacterium]|nr:hypothetical protein [Caulobacterales bacterium]